MKTKYVMNVYEDESRETLIQTVSLKASSIEKAVYEANIWLRKDNMDFGIEVTEFYGVGSFQFKYVAPFMNGASRVVSVEAC